MRETCPLTNERCKYFNKPAPPELRDKQEHGCFADTSHPYHPKPLVEQLGRMVARRLNLNYNPAVRMNNEQAKQQCRSEHDEYHFTVPFNLQTFAQIVEWERMRRQSDGLQEPDR